MKEVSNYDAIKEVGKRFRKGIIPCLKFVYLCPTSNREHIENLLEKEGNNKKIYMDHSRSEYNQRLGETAFIGSVMLAPWIGAGLTAIVTSPFFSPNIRDPIICAGAAVGVVTNLFSGAYEYVRYTKEQMQGELDKKEQNLALIVNN